MLLASRRRTRRFFGSGERAATSAGTLNGSATLSYYDPNALPQLSAVEPSVAPADAPARLAARGSNFAPLGGGMVCGFGVAGQTATDWDSCIIDVTYPQDNENHDLVFTVRAAENTAELFLDGALVGSTQRTWLGAMKGCGGRQQLFEHCF